MKGKPRENSEKKVSTNQADPYPEALAGPRGGEHFETRLVEAASAWR